MKLDVNGVGVLRWMFGIKIIDKLTQYHDNGSVKGVAVVPKITEALRACEDGEAMRVLRGMTHVPVSIMRRSFADEDYIMVAFNICPYLSGATECSIVYITITSAEWFTFRESVMNWNPEIRKFHPQSNVLYEIVRPPTLGARPVAPIQTKIRTRAFQNSFKQTCLAIRHYNTKLPKLNNQQAFVYLRVAKNPLWIATVVVSLGDSIPPLSPRPLLKTYCYRAKVGGK